MILPVHIIKDICRYLHASEIIDIIVSCPILEIYIKKFLSININVLLDSLNNPMKVKYISLLYNLSIDDTIRVTDSIISVSQYETLIEIYSSNDFNLDSIITRLMINSDEDTIISFMPYYLRLYSLNTLESIRQNTIELFVEVYDSDILFLQSLHNNYTRIINQFRKTNYKYKNFYKIYNFVLKDPSLIQFVGYQFDHYDKIDITNFIHDFIYTIDISHMNRCTPIHTELKDHYNYNTELSIHYNCNNTLYGNGIFNSDFMALLFMSIAKGNQYECYKYKSRDDIIKHYANQYNKLQEYYDKNNLDDKLTYIIDDVMDTSARYFVITLRDFSSFNERCIDMFGHIILKSLHCQLQLILTAHPNVVCKFIDLIPIDKLHNFKHFILENSSFIVLHHTLNRLYPNVSHISILDYKYHALHPITYDTFYKMDVCKNISMELYTKLKTMNQIDSSIISSLKEKVI